MSRTANLVAASRWYNEDRPHMTLDGKTSSEVYKALERIVRQTIVDVLKKESHQETALARSILA